MTKVYKALHDQPAHILGRALQHKHHRVIENYVRMVICGGLERTCKLTLLEARGWKSEASPDQYYRQPRKG